MNTGFKTKLSQSDLSLSWLFYFIKMEKKQTAVDWLLENLNEYNLEQVAVMAREKEARIIELAYMDGAIDMAESRTSSGVRYFIDNYGSI